MKNRRFQRIWKQKTTMTNEQQPKPAPYQDWDLAYLDLEEYKLKKTLDSGQSKNIHNDTAKLYRYRWIIRNYNEVDSQKNILNFIQSMNKNKN